jgi:cell division protein ZapE
MTTRRSPQARYHDLLARSQLSADPVQAAVVERLDDLFLRLSAPQPRGPVAWWRRWRGERLEPVRGLYLWGGVGRGKTMLMDLFYEALPEGARLRIHFHRFMQRVHRDLTDLTGTANPLEIVAGRFAAESTVLCFDELFVSDIGDAMILGELLDALFARGVTLVATSNVAPPDLYRDGLQRRRFLPVIAELEKHCEVHHVDGATDYRLRVLERLEIYHAPLDRDAEEGLARYFGQLAPDEAAEHDVTIEVERRPIRVRRLAEDVAWFDFAELCEGPRSQNDYIELAREFHAVLVSGVPRFDASREDSARRFISLIDEFYDRNVKLIVSAEVEPGQLYAGERLRFEFERTVSRLLEMQSRSVPAPATTR